MRMVSNRMVVNDKFCSIRWFSYSGLLLLRKYGLGMSVVR